ncbi:peptidase [Abyssibius alkaniclasticus]|uniref:peptidase n=1 Tax=Abyssibius alkaniclasticus TaxID=2881234 RepID=UPI0023634CFC|nr:peptidase [Abyssibius alkaniclasticus]UPH70901.1 peptidase [Abyssibius alkaniclasticus]
MGAETGRAAAEIARGWLGTPYQHQASCKGAGADCLGLLRGVWRALYGGEPMALPAYTPDWGECDGREALLDGARKLLLPAGPELQTGDVLVLRMRSNGPAKHLAILGQSAPCSLIHAYSGRGVVESSLTPAWARRIAGHFRFPDRSE